MSVNLKLNLEGSVSTALSEMEINPFENPYSKCLRLQSEPGYSINRFGEDLYSFTAPS